MKVELHVHVHNDSHGGSEAVLAAIAELRKAMASEFKDVDEALDALDALTTEIGGNVDIVVANEADQLALIKQLQDQLAAGSGVTKDQLDTLAAKAAARKSALETISAHLKLVANPSAPTPPAPPVVL